MALIGTVTKNGAGDKPFTARLTDGKTLGNYESPRAAQLAIEQSNGGRLIRWSRLDLSGSIECYRGEA